jgi:hypothetical protein
MRSTLQKGYPMKDLPSASAQALLHPLSGPAVQGSSQYRRRHRHRRFIRPIPEFYKEPGYSPYASKHFGRPLFGDEHVHRAGQSSGV